MDQVGVVDQDVQVIQVFDGFVDDVFDWFDVDQVGFDCQVVVVQCGDFGDGFGGWCDVGYGDVGIGLC